jgi:hypothetical protein
MDYDEAVKHLHSLLRDFPLVLILDGLDLLDNDHLARSDLTFLLGVHPHPLTRIIISALPDGNDPGNGLMVC